MQHRLLWSVALLLGVSWLVNAQSPVHELLVHFPEDVPPEQVTIITGAYGNGLVGGSLTTKAGVRDYTEKLNDKTTAVKLLCYRPGYRMLTANLSAAQLAEHTPFVPHFEKLASTPVTLTFVSPEGTPLPGTKVVLSHSLETHQFFGYGNGPMYFTDIITGVTDATGAYTFALPLLDTDPYFAAHPVTVSLRIPGEGKRPDPTRDLAPSSLTFTFKTPTPITITVTQRAKLHGRIAVDYIRAQGLRGEITPYEYTTRPTGPVRVELRAEVPNEPSVSCMLLDNGEYSTMLPPGTYELVLVETGPEGTITRKYHVTERGYGGETYRKRVPLHQTITLRAGEDKVVKVYPVVKTAFGLI